MQIRKAKLDDANEIIKIYGFYVENTAISFEYETPSVEDFKKRIEFISNKYPYLVLIDNYNKISGYAYANVLKDRKAYDKSCEVTIYIDNQKKGNGYGKALYQKLEKELKKIGILNLYACIATTEKEDNYLNNDSEKFHQHLGYTKIGEFHKCGYKFQKWYNMIWMEKIIGEHK